MAQFRVLGAPDVIEILNIFGHPPTAYLGHQPIAVGTINTNVRVDTTHGSFFLRVNEGKTLDDVAREAAIVAYLSSRGVSTPAPFHAVAGPGAKEPYGRWRDEIVSLFPWLSGRTLERGEVTAEHARQVGSALGILHRVGVSFPDHTRGRYEPDEIDRRLDRVAGLTASDPLLADAAATLRPELGSLTVARARDLPLGLIHGDLFIDNVLFDGARLVAMLDFEQASWGRLAYDLAVTTLAFGFGRTDFRPEIVAALFDGYLAQRLLTDDERNGFGHELRFAACRFAMTRITDVHLKRTAGAAPGKDFRRYLLRLARVKEHLEAEDGLLIPRS